MKNIRFLGTFIILAIIFSFFPKNEIFAISAADCEKYKNTCPDESLISQIKSVCGTSVLNSVNSACAAEKASAEKRMSELSAQKTQIEKKEGTANWYLSNVNSEISKINAEIVNTDMTLEQVESELTKLNEVLSKQKDYLSALMRQVYEYDTTSYVEMLLGNSSLSEFSEKIAEVNSIQRNITDSLSGVVDTKEALEKKKEEELNYKTLQESSRQSLSVKRNQQQYLLSQLQAAKTPIQKEMAKLNAEIIELKASMGRIQNYLSSWLIGGAPTWSQIFSAVQNASSATGVRPALLLGILETESRFGTGLGKTGHYQEYCNWGWTGCNNLTILLQICSQYGYDPNKVPMSTRCALGPAQFIPCTWRVYGGNPWNLYDAVMAMAKYLKRNGAPGNERGAVYAYNHSSSYVDTVMARADIWQSVINICGLNLSCPQMRQKLEASGIPIN